MVQSTTGLHTRIAPATSALFVGAALSSAVIATTSTVAALVAVDVLGRAWGGVPGTAAVVGTGVGALLVTSLTRRSGTPTALRLGYLATALGAAAGAVAVPLGHVGLLVVAMLLIGLGNAAAQLSRYVAAELVPTRRRGFAIGLIVWAGTVGAVGGPLLLLPTARFAHTLGQPALSGAFLLSVPAGLLAALAVSRLRTARRPGSRSGASFRAIWVSRAGRDGLAVMVTGQVVMAVVMTSVPVQLHLHHHGLDVVGLVLAAHTLGMFVLSPVTGRLVDRLGPGPVMALGLATLLASTLVAASGDLVPQAMGLFVLGYGWNLCFVGGSASLAVGLPEEQRAGVEGMAEAVVWISAAVGTLTSTMLLVVGGWSVVTLAAGSIVLVPALLLLSGPAHIRFGSAPPGPTLRGAPELGASREPEATVLIRPERPADVDAIDRLTIEAFEPQWFSDGSEAPIIRALRATGDLTLSLVAEDDGDVIGHVAFSPVTIDGAHDGWFGLGPISVRLDRQRRGIGRALVAEGLRRLRDREARGCALIGDPNIYGRMGFTGDGQLSHHELDRAVVQHITFSGPPPRGELRFAPAFDAGGH